MQKTIRLLGESSASQWIFGCGRRLTATLDPVPARIRRLFKTLVGMALALWSLSGSLWAQFPHEIGQVTARLDAPVTHFSGEEVFKTTVILDVSRGWHIGWRHIGLIGQPTTISLKLPRGIELVEQRWSLPHYRGEGGLDSLWIYEGRAAVQLMFRASKEFSGEGDFSAQIDYLICHDSCYNGTSSVEGKIVRGTQAGREPDTSDQSGLLFEQPLSERPEVIRTGGSNDEETLRFPRLGGAVVEVFCAADTVIGFSVTTSGTDLVVNLKKQPSAAPQADILIVVRPAGKQAEFGVRL